MSITMQAYQRLAVMLLLTTLIVVVLAAPAWAAESATGAVNVEALNLRAGPGLNYLVLRVLKKDQALTLLGRSADSAWLDVRLANGTGGWVYAAYVATKAELGRLPVSQASGGPAATTDFTCANTTFNLCMTIRDGQAALQVQKFLAQVEIVVRLGRSGSEPELIVANGRTDADGKAQIGFAMPRTWANGAPLTEQNLILSVTTPDGSFSRSANILFVR